ncbi:hypothetical protein [Oligoflexus tunisiensis]|uniref:hypothetical protein n=1 Tax=Oligoflexus tunisiensis TaxID=708132 RepID=UPI00114CDC99|nr:hypothetical protein [Oligoflexus tunisiensis]
MTYAQVFITAALILTACSKKAEGPRFFASEPVQTWEDVPDLSQEDTALRADLKEDFCAQAERLALTTDFYVDLTLLCDDGKPHEMLDRIDRYAGHVGDAPRSIKLDLEHEADGFTRVTYLTAFRVPLDPQAVRKASLPTFMVAASRFPYVHLEGTVLADPKSQDDPDTGPWHLSYRAQVETSARISFSLERRTELRSYPLEDGNPDINLSAEHLIGASHPDFKFYNTTTMTMGHEEGGSTLITITRLSVRHNGFPELAEQIFSDLASAQAMQIQDGLLSEMAAGRKHP